MLRKIILANPVALQSAAWRPASTRLLMMRASDPVVDKEAEQEQMEQVSQQMEDAIVKENQVRTTQQANKSNKMWDTSSETIRLADEDLPQSKAEDLSNIEKEQIKLLEQEQAALPGRSEHLHGDKKTSLTMKDSEKGIVDKVLDTMTKTKETLKETFPGVHDFGHEVKKTAKSATESVTGKGGAVDKALDTVAGTKQTLKGTFPAVHEFGHEVKETSKASMDDLTNMAKSSMTSSTSTDPNIKHDTEVTQAGDPKLPKPKSKKFSGNKQNSSLL
jgi:uncharacterized protein YoxC